MQTNYFQGKDGFIWWHGVVEDRQDPLYLGRCKVRILGWHTEDKAELPTASLPWAQVLMPVTSASQTNVGHAPVGPVEGTWVMGFYRDGELGQEPVIMGTIPGIPENHAKQRTGFNDPRLDVPSADRQGTDVSGKATKGVPGETLDAFPFPPKEVKTKAGGEAEITPYTDDERKNFGSIHYEQGSGSLYPRELNKPTTSKYARGSEDSTSEATTSGIISSKISNTQEVDVLVPAFTPSNVFLPEGLEIGTGPNTRVGTNEYILREDYNFLKQAQITKTITQPSSAYAARYPFNHVYESESGHLIEQDDTPGKERLHWYHRSGTFTEFHPAGMRVDRTNAHRYNIVTGNYESIITGEEKKSVTGDFTLNLGGRLTLKSSKDISITSETGDVIIDSNILNTYIGGKNIILDAKDTLVLRAGRKIIREDDSAEDKVKGTYNLTVGGGYNVSSGSLGLSTGIGSLRLTSGGSLQQIVAGNSEESIVNKDYIFGNVFAKKITALNGIISIESTGLIPTTAGIDLNVGLFGLNSSIKMLPLGDMLVTSVTGPTGITMAATANITQTATLIATLVGAVSTVIGSSSSPLTTIDGTAIQVGGTGASEPAILGTTFLKLFSKHTHPSPNGPTGPLSPEFASDLISTVSKKVFLA